METSDNVSDDAEDRITRERREHKIMREYLEAIAEMIPPENAEEEAERVGLDTKEFIEMAYENAISMARSALKQIAP